jgi:hypothetical protein
VFYRQEPVDELDFTITNLYRSPRWRPQANDRDSDGRAHRSRSCLATSCCVAFAKAQCERCTQATYATFVPLSSDIASHHICFRGHREMVLKLMYRPAHCCLKDLPMLSKSRRKSNASGCNAKSKVRGLRPTTCNKEKEVGDSSADYEAELKSLFLLRCSSL